MRYSKNWNASIGRLNLTLGARNVIWAFLFCFSFVSSASWLVLGGVMSSRCQAAIALLRIVFSCNGWLQCAVLISCIRIIHLHGFFFISWASSRAKNDCYVGRTHCSLQDKHESIVCSMFTVPNVFGAWQCDKLNLGLSQSFLSILSSGPGAEIYFGWHSLPLTPLFQVANGLCGIQIFHLRVNLLRDGLMMAVVCRVPQWGASQVFDSIYGQNSHNTLLSFILPLLLSDFAMNLVNNVLYHLLSLVLFLYYEYTVLCDQFILLEHLYTWEVLLKSHVHPVQYVDGVRTSMRYLQTTCSVDIVIVLFRVDNTCHRSCDLVTHHTLCCI